MLGSADVRDCVRKAGYLEYDNGVFSKHRGLFIDLDFKELMGPVDTIPPPPSRGIRSDDQPSVDRYLAAFHAYADEHNIWHRVSELSALAPSIPQRHLKDCYDAIDRDITRGMLHAEKQAKRGTGKYAWSPKLREAGLLARYWHLRLRAAQKGIDLRLTIARLVQRIKSLNIVFDANVFVSDTATGTADDTIDRTDTGTANGTTVQGVTVRTGTETFTGDTSTGTDTDNASGTATATAPDPNIITELKARWKTAIKLLRKVRDAAYDHRAVHLKATLVQYTNMKFNDDEESEAAENKIKIRRIQQLINIENMRKPFRAIHSSVTPGHGGGLSKLFVPSGVKDKKVAARFCSPDGTVNRSQLIKMAQSDKLSVEYKTLLDCDEIDAELLRYNRDWFRQASETPFGHGELFDMLGFSGLTDEANAIIEGDCIAHLGIPMSREIETFLEECRRPASVTPVDPVISVKAFVKTIKAWKETTSTSPSGRHLGHYRTAILDPRVARLHTDMLNIPIASGFAPDRWLLSVTPLIEKDEGLPYLTRLRVIHLFEADYNLFLKLVYGRRMVQNAEKANALNDQQHGSRPRRMTTDALFLARLEKDLIRQTKANSAHMDNDATGCYDRIVVSLGMLACRRLGMPVHTVSCQANALRNLRYAIKLLAGISAGEYFGEPDDPLFGTGQGSGASGAIWLALVVILLNCLDRLSTEDNIPGLSFSDPWNEFLEAWRVGAFVDDTNQGVMDPLGVLTLDELVEQMRKAGQLWETLLHISGGSLNLAKCSWTVQFWQWIKGRPSLMPLSSNDPALLMTSGTNPETHIIRRHTNEEALKGLGVHMNFHGTFEHHAKTMRFKFDELARRLQRSAMSTTLSQVYYNTFYLPSVRYSLPVTSMTEQELHRSQSLMTATILNKLGYNRHYPHAVAFAPRKVFGCGLVDLRIEQGLCQIQAFLDYVGTDHKVGNVIIISLRHLQVEAGVSFDILCQPKTPLTYLTDCWVLSLRRFCAAHDISMRALKNKVPTISRIGDRLLMDVASTLGLTRQEMIDLNLARTFLQVTSISDIAMADGLTIHPWIWRGRRIPDRCSILKFARQQQPTPYQFGLWRKLLRSVISPDATHDNHILLQSLGPWTAPSNMVWGAMMHGTTLYRRDPFHNSGERNVAVHFPRSLESPPISFYENPPDWYTATVPALAIPADLNGDQILTVTTATLEFAPIPPAAKTFQAWISQLPPAEKRMLSSVYFAQCDAEYLLLQYLQLDCTLFIGTDGGKRHHNGSYSWILCSPGREQLCLNAGPVDGWFKCQSSLRSEAAALAAVTLYLDELANWATFTIECKFKLFVDSTSAISNVTLLREQIPKRRFADNADILSVMRAAHPVISRYTLEHVKSHQDEKTDFDQLPFHAQLNVLCDQMATNQLKRQRTNAWEATQTCPLPPRNLPVEVKIGRQIISSHYVKRLREEIGIDRHRSFLQAKYKWSDQVWVTIAWESFEHRASRPNLDQLANRSKIVHNWLNLGSQRARHGRCPDTLLESRCPFCTSAEDFQHLLTCTAPRAQKFRYDGMMKLRKALDGTQGGAAILRAIKAWTLDPAIAVATSAGAKSYEHAVSRAMASQHAIGWENIFRGFISIEWGHIYTAEDKTPPEMRRTRSVSLVSKYIKAFQDYTLFLWKSRNDVLHEAGSDGLSSVHASLNHDISQMYALRDTFSPILQSYFRKPLEDRLKGTPRQRARWLQLAQIATSHSSAAGSRQTMVSHFFKHAPSTTGASPTGTVPHGTVPEIPAILQQVPITSFLTPRASLPP